MTVFWCRWCGDTMEAVEPETIVRCEHCVREGLRLFGFWPATIMVPLRLGEKPGAPVSLRKRFVFVDVETGAVVGETETPRTARRTETG